ncbi:bifunctional phosphopantothenoylcysteine decarboxylase/phosphopantothenate--cysteine ligase CoaBC [Rickettsiales bacterium]|nr:bifunctional phosphopantothenoylcysteine decarboxylase/phosphopantothenate--cysteine ligase CoaBC [Rickettsiales bacterium]
MSNILIIITGSVAAYKALDLILDLRQRGFNIEVIQTKASQNFVKKLDVESLTNKSVYDNLWSDDELFSMHHINLTRKSDYVIVYPASADFINKAAAGFAENLALATILACDKKVMFMPAMNKKMYENPFTQENIQKLQKVGHIFLGPDSGMLACGEEGFGRLVESRAVLTKLDEIECLKERLFNKKVLITAGATVENIDPVRYISNYSSGKQGYEIAKSLADLGAEVTFVYGNVDIKIDHGFAKSIQALTAKEMHKAVIENAANTDIAVMAAAVCDYTPKEVFSHKIKKQNQEEMVLTLVKNPDILFDLCNLDNRPAIVIGFAAETNNLIDNARKKLKSKNCDYIIANDVGSNDIFGSDKTKISLVSKTYVKDFDNLFKSEVAKFVFSEIL